MRWRELVAVLALGLPAAAAVAPAVLAAEGARAAIEAYEQGRYDEALAAFERQSERRPRDDEARIRLGSAQYQLSDYQAAQRSFENAAASKSPLVRARAHYALGNTAFRAGQLEEARGHYLAALEDSPGDISAKYNYEVTQRALERQQQQQQQPQQQDQQQDEQQNEQQNEQQGGGQGGEPPPGTGPDRDADGLPDPVEQQGENPTDPQNPDTDGDGRGDGQEDRNRNGRVDPGESNPAVADEAPAGEGQQSRQPGEQGQLALPPEGAARLLDALQEQRPENKRGRRSRAAAGKDW